MSLTKLEILGAHYYNYNQGLLQLRPFLIQASVAKHTRQEVTSMFIKSLLRTMVCIFTFLHCCMKTTGLSVKLLVIFHLLHNCFLA